MPCNADAVLLAKGEAMPLTEELIRKSTLQSKTIKPWKGCA